MILQIKCVEEKVKIENLVFIMAVDICHKGQHEFFFFSHVARGILVPQPGIKLTTLTVKAQSLNHWTNREIP